MDTKLKERPVHALRDAYFKLVEAGVQLSLRELARRSEELTGEKTPYEGFRKVAAREGWVASARKILQEHSSEEYQRLITMLDEVYARIEAAEEPKDFCPAIRAYLTLLTNCTVDVVHLEEERIIQVRDWIFHFIEERGATMPALYLPRLTYVYFQLKNRVEADLTVTEEDGINPDELLMRV